MKDNQSFPDKKQKRPENARPTIGLLTLELSTPFWAAMWSGVADVAREQDANLISFTGGMLDDPKGFHRQANVLYDLVDVEELDGLVIWGAVGIPVGPERAREFYGRYGSIPIVSMAEMMEGLTCVLADNYGGMRQAIIHLIEEHGYRCIAYVKGQEGFQEHEDRFQAYCDVLAEYGLPYDSDLVITQRDTERPHDDIEVGNIAVRILMDERKVEFDAVAVNDDEPAYGVIDELTARGLQVPRDIAVVSFDDLKRSQFTTPPLTTVPFPFYEMGRQAAELLLAQLRGKSVPEQVFTSTQMVVRESCGCLDPNVEQAAATGSEMAKESLALEGKASGERLAQVLAARRADILSLLQQTSIGNEDETIDSGRLPQLLDAFETELQGTPGVFLRELEAILSQIVVASGDVCGWQKVISVLRRELRPYLADEGIVLRRVDDLWHQARVMIADMDRRVEGCRGLQAEQQTQLLNEIGQALITTVDIQEMMDVLAENLPRLGIERCYLSLYEDPERPAEEARLMLAYDEEKRQALTIDGRVFPAPNLVPQGMYRREQRFSLVVEALYFREDQLGFVLFEEGGRDGQVYETIRGQISSALKGALLIKERQKIEDALAYERDLFQTLMDSSPDYIFFKDRESRFIRTNKAHLEVMGLSSLPEVVGKTDFDLFPLEDAQRFFDEEQKIMRSGRPVIGREWPIPTATGEQIWVSENKIPMADENGQIIGLMGTTRDVTARKQVEAALQEGEHRLRTIMDSVQAGIVIIDAETREIVDANPAAIRMIDAARNTVLGSVCHKFICPAEQGKCPICDLGQKVDNAERVLLTAQGEIIPIIKNVVTVTLEGRQYLVESFADISRQKETTEALSKRATELETVAQVSTAALNILDTTELLQTVVDLTKERFGLYHAHIYFLDQISQTLILAAGAGDVGRQMVAEGWSIPLDREQSLVAGAARSRQGVIVNDVRVAPDWLPNPLLPNTRSELAVPLIASGSVLGVLDVQSEEEGHFTGDDIRIQTTLAAQVAVALENARLFEQAEKADTLLHERVKELDCLNDIGREMEENPPPLPELLQWITERIPSAMQYPELSVAAIEFDNHVYGIPEAVELPSQITHGLYIGGQMMGRIYIGHTEEREFIDEESALLGGIATRLSGFIENQRLLEQTQERATELEAATTFLDSIVENIPVMLFVKDAEELRFVRWNRAGEEIVGMSREEMFGKNDYDFFPKEEADFFTAKDREVLNDGKLVDIPEEPIQTADKGTRYLHTTKIPVYGPDGKPRYLLGISEDITERKQAATEQERLLADIRRLAAIVENHPDFIGVGTLDGRALYVNPAGLRMMGLPPDHDVTTMDASDFYPVEDAEKLLKEGVPTALEQGSWNSEANLLKADSTTVPVEETVSINYDREGNPASFSITMHDITNRKVAATEQARLLAEVEASYRQYVRQEWEQYLQEHHQGRWHFEHQQPNVDLEPAPDWLAKIQAEVLQAGETRVVKESGDHGQVNVSAGDGRQNAAIVAPIALRGQVIGTLNLQDLAPDRNWTAEEITLVEAVSEQLGLTVENLRLFDDTQRTATREQLTRQITDRMRAAPDVDSIIQTGLTELAKALQVSRTYVKLSTPPEQDT